MNWPKQANSGYATTFSALADDHSRSRIHNATATQANDATHA